MTKPNKHFISRAYIFRQFYFARKFDAKISRKDLGQILGLTAKEIDKIENCHRDCAIPSKTLRKIIAAGIKSITGQ